MEVGRCPMDPLATLLNGRTRQYIYQRGSLCASIHTKYSPVFATLGETPLLVQEGNHGVQKAADTDVNPHPGFLQILDKQTVSHGTVPSIKAIGRTTEVLKEQFCVSCCFLPAPAGALSSSSLLKTALLQLPEFSPVAASGRSNIRRQVPS